MTCMTMTMPNFARQGRRECAAAIRSSGLSSSRSAYPRQSEGDWILLVGQSVETLVTRPEAGANISNSTLRLHYGGEPPLNCSIRCETPPQWGARATASDPLPDDLPGWVDGGGGFVRVARTLAEGGVRILAADLGPHSELAAGELLKRDTGYVSVGVVPQGRRQIRVIHPRYNLIQAIIDQPNFGVPNPANAEQALRPLLNGGLPAKRAKAVVILPGASWSAQELFANYAVVWGLPRYSLIDESVTDRHLEDHLSGDVVTFATTSGMRAILERLEIKPPRLGLSRDSEGWHSAVAAAFGAPPLNGNSAAFALLEPHSGHALILDNRTRMAGLVKMNRMLLPKFRRTFWYLSEALVSDRLLSVIVAEGVLASLNGTRPTEAVRVAFERAFSRVLGLAPLGSRMFVARPMLHDAKGPLPKRSTPAETLAPELVDEAKPSEN